MPACQTLPPATRRPGTRPGRECLFGHPARKWVRIGVAEVGNMEELYLRRREKMKARGLVIALALTAVLLATACLVSVPTPTPTPTPIPTPTPTPTPTLTPTPTPTPGPVARIITTVAGSPVPLGDGGPAMAAQLSLPAG